MNKKIFRSILLVSSLTLFFGIFLLTFVLHRNYSDQNVSIWSLFLSIWHYVAGIVVVMIAFAAVISSLASKNIVKPINAIDPDNLDSGMIYDELAPLTLRITRQRATINEQLQEAARRQKEFRLIAENMREGMLVIDRHTNLLSSNSAAIEMLGVTTPQGSQSVLAINRSDSFRRVVERSIAGEHSEEILSENGRVYQLIGNPVRMGKAVAGAIILILDITEKWGREKLRQEFAANVSHELKTPLTSISGFAEIMKDRGVSGGDVVDFSGRIYDEAQRLILLVNDIIKVSVLDEESLLFDETPIDLSALAAGVVKGLGDYADSSNITLSFKSGGEPLSVTGNAKILEEMIYNLCENGIKYNNPGGKVDVSVQKSDDGVLLTVSDDGIGIEEKYQERIFERFFRVDKSHSSQTPGTGLGLSIVKRAALFHKAKLEVESVIGSGTKIMLIFSDKKY